MIRCYLVLIALTSIFSAELTAARDSSNHPLVWEFLPDPTGLLQSEWIELYNPGDTGLDISRFNIGDELGWRTISDTSLVVPGLEFILLVQDSAAFADFYGDVPCVVMEPDGWQILNNGGDIVRLGTTDGVTLDSCVYSSGLGDNRSWERYRADNGENYWGGAYDPSGSTPGRVNSFYPRRAETITLTVSPDPFSPDGDGCDDQTVISYEMPNGDSFDLRLYDLGGLEVRTLIDAGPAVPGEIIWDGRGDDGRYLPTGVYILFARCDGEPPIETKRTIAVIR